MPLAPGARIGPYQVVSLLGKGGMGEVYLARDLRLDRDVALKMLPAELLADAERRIRFAREAKLASRLVHPNAAVIYEVGQSGDADFLAMEFVEGESLNQRLRNGPLPLAELLELSSQLAGVLLAAHERGIVHRDIKPGNIIVTPAGQLELLDFGLARIHSREVSQDDSTVTAATPLGAILGTPDYMSPEQVLGREADHRSDIFSTGVVFYQMATGMRPFRAPNTAATLANILQTPPEPIARWNYEAPVEYERIVRKCLEKSPENRYQSAREICIDLRNLKQTATITGSAVPAPAARPPRLNRRALLTAAAGTIVAGGIGSWAWQSLFPRIRSLAVLPLANSGPPESAYLSDGLTETLINQFAQVSRLRVLARSTVYNNQVPVNNPQAAGRKLGVAVVLAGRLDPGPAQLVLTLNLIASSDGRQLWGKRIERAVGELELAAAELARQALEAIGLTPQGRPGESVRPVDADAYRAYLRGRYQLNKHTRAGIEASMEQFKEALDHDPTYAPAYAQMAVALVFRTSYTTPKDVFPEAQASAERALDLDPHLAEAHNALGLIRLYRQWDWGGSEEALTRAIELNPNYAGAHANYALLLTCGKRFEQAIVEVNRGAELDPLSSVHPATLGYVYYQARQFDRAIAQLGKALAADGRSPQAYFYRGTANIAVARFDRAIADFDAGLKLSPGNGGAIADQGMAYARAGNRDKAREAIAIIEKLAKQSYVSPYLLASPYLGLGEEERALDCLEKAAEDRSGWVVYSSVEPKFDALRANPRFQHLVKLIGPA
ncbi:MAG: protein kinase [Candidatus Sulfopaludibacter sp.]|nr:protein kinase [Candidatus Sulfopaludibacter sp.]